MIHDNRPWRRIGPVAQEWNHEECRIGEQQDRRHSDSRSERWKRTKKIKRVNRPIGPVTELGADPMWMEAEHPRAATPITETASEGEFTRTKVEDNLGCANVTNCHSRLSCA
jgi:hypothetical protein